MAQRLRHVGVVVSDLDLALEIYQNYLQCQLISRSDNISGEFIGKLVGLDQCIVSIALLKTRDNSRIELLQYINPISLLAPVVTANQLGVSHFALTVDNLEQLYNQKERFKTRFISPILTSPEGWVKVAYVIVMNEHIVELVEVLDERATYSGGP